MRGPDVESRVREREKEREREGGKEGESDARRVRARLVLVSGRDGSVSRAASP